MITMTTTTVIDENEGEDIGNRQGWRPTMMRKRMTTMTSPTEAIDDKDGGSSCSCSDDYRVRRLDKDARQQQEKQHRRRDGNTDLLSYFQVERRTKSVNNAWKETKVTCERM